MALLEAAIDSRGAVQGADQFDRSARRIVRSGERVDRSVRGVDDRMRRLGRTSQTLRRTLVGVFAGLSAVGALRDATQVVSGFEETIVVLGGVTQATEAQLESLEQTARRFGATTRFSAQESGEGLLFLARAGFTTEQSIAALPGTLDLAQVGLLGLGESADLASNVVSQFGLRADQTGEVVDALVITANRANTSVQQLGQALKFAGPVAGTLGLTVQDTSNALGVLGDRGLQGAIAGTNLRKVLLSLESPTNAGARAIQRYGIALDDVVPSQNDLADVFDRLKPVLADTDAAIDIFGTKMFAAAQIIGSSTGRLRELRQAQIDNTGEAGRLARAMDDTLSGAFKTLRSTVEEAFLRLGDSGFTGGLKDLTRAATDVIRVLIGMEDAVEGNIDEAREMARMVEFLAGSAGFFALAKGVQLTTSAVIGLTAAVAVNPLGTLLVGISAAAGAIFAFRNELVTLGDETATIGQFIVAAFVVVRDRLIAVFQLIVETFRVIIDRILEDNETFINVAIVAFTDLRDRVGMALEDFGGALLDFFKDTTNNVVALLVTLKDNAVDLLSAVVVAFNAVINFDPTRPVQSVNAVISAVDSLKDASKDLGKDFTKNLSRDFVGEGLEEFKAALTEVFEAVDAIASDADLPPLSQLLDFDSAVDDFREVLGKLRDDASGAGGSAGSVTGGAASAFDALGDAGEESAERVSDAYDSLGDSIERSVTNEIEDIAFQTDSLAEGIRDLAQELIRLQLRRAVAGGFDAFRGGDVTSAHGNIFSSRSVVPFNRGGTLIRQPSTFDLADGRRALVGEQTEAMFPVTRKNGKLAIEGADSGGSRQTTVNMTVVTPDADSFRRSERQLTRQLRRRAR